MCFTRLSRNRAWLRSVGLRGTQCPISCPTIGRGIARMGERHWRRRRASRARPKRAPMAGSDDRRGRPRPLPPPFVQPRGSHLPAGRLQAAREAGRLHRLHRLRSGRPATGSYGCVSALDAGRLPALRRNPCDLGSDAAAASRWRGCRADRGRHGRTSGWPRGRGALAIVSRPPAEEAPMGFAVAPVIAV